MIFRSAFQTEKRVRKLTETAKAVQTQTLVVLSPIRRGDAFSLGNVGSRDSRKLLNGDLEEQLINVSLERIR